jgi:ribonuclease HII
MAYLIGTDEAGYGPNLGPLVIALSVWQVPDDCLELDLYDVLGDVVVTAETQDAQRLAIADSKQLYRPGTDLSLLERGVLNLLATRQSVPQTWHALCELVCGPAVTRLRTLPWYGQYNVSLPTSAGGSLDDALLASWRQAALSAEVHLIAMRAAVLDPEEFNDGVARYDSKGALLSHRTLDLVLDVLSELGDQPLRIVCDKHGGRNLYGPLLQMRFDNGLVRVICEGRRASVYEVGTRQRSVRIGFYVGGESFLPAAAASMLAKYLRELSMRAFNAFWQSHLPDLRPTAGYPGDAGRFREQIRPVQQRLGIDDHRLWRCR